MIKKLRKSEFKTKYITKQVSDKITNLSGLKFKHDQKANGLSKMTIIIIYVHFIDFLQTAVYLWRRKLMGKCSITTCFTSVSENLFISSKSIFNL